MISNDWIFIWIHISLVVFDSLILCFFWVLLRNRSLRHGRSLERSVKMGVVFGVFHAVLFFSGAILAIQLVFNAAICGLCWLTRRQSEDLATQIRSSVGQDSA